MDTLNTNAPALRRWNGRRGMRVFFRRHAVLHIWLLCALLAAAAFHLSKENRALMNALAEHVTGPVKETLGALCAEVPFSVAEVALFTAAGIVLLYLGALVGGLIRCRRRGNLLYTRLLGFYYRKSSDTCEL